MSSSNHWFSEAIWWVGSQVSNKFNIVQPHHHNNNDKDNEKKKKKKKKKQNQTSEAETEPALNPQWSAPVSPINSKAACGREAAKLLKVNRVTHRF